MTDILILAIAGLHLLFLILEMFLWNTPYGRKVFGLSPEFAEQSSKLAANQGLYNGFLAAGLAWAVISHQLEWKLFFLACVVIAGVYGGLTVKRSILFIQALPAIIALVLIHTLK